MKANISLEKYRSQNLEYYNTIVTEPDNLILSDYIEIISYDSKTQYILEAVDEAVNLNLFSEKLFMICENIIKNNKKGFFIKLTCLDYFICMKDKVEDYRYYSVSKFLLNSSNLLLSLQSCINCFRVEKKIEYEDKILSLFLCAEYPSLYYRLLNNFDYYPDLIKEFSADFFDVLKIILRRKKFREPVVLELSSALQKITDGRVN